MQKFYFRTRHGTDIRDDPDGVELKDLKAAWRAATCAAGEILKNADDLLDPERDWRMDVTNDQGQPLFSLRLIPETYLEGEKMKAR